MTSKPLPNKSQYIAEDDLPYWLKEHLKESPLEARPELKLDDEWVEDEKSSKFANYLLKFVATMVVISAVSLLIFAIFRYDKMALATTMLFFLMLAVLVVGESIKFFRNLKAINRSWQKFAELYGLHYEINKDNRSLGGDYQGHLIFADTYNSEDSKLQTRGMLSRLRISPDTHISISTYGKLDKLRNFLDRKNETKLGDFEQRFKVTTQPKHLAYVISGSTMLCQRLLKIEAHQAKLRIEIMDEVLFFEQVKPLDKVENWQYLLNTLCILVRTIERAEK